MNDPGTSAALRELGRLWRKKHRKSYELARELWLLAELLRASSSPARKP
jgi:hypothetical protein